MANKEQASKAELYRKERKERIAKEAKKNAKRTAKVAKIKRTILKSVAVVVAAAIVLGAAIAIVNYTGSSLFKMTVAKAGDTKISTSEFQYYYRTSHANLVSQASQYDQYYGTGYYAQNQGFDYTLLPSEQDFPNAMLDKEALGIEEDFETWDDYITFSTLNSIQYFYMLAAEAEKAGMELTEDEAKAITDQIDELRATAEENGRSLNAYLRASYGSGINENSLEKWMLRDALAEKYATEKQAELYDSYTAADINAEFKENKNDYSFVDFRYYVFAVDAGEIKDGAKEDEVKAAQEKAEKKAKKEAEAFLKDIKSEKDFLKAAEALDKKNATTDSKAELKVEDTTLLEKCTYDAFVQNFSEKDADWAFSSDLKAGETKILAQKEGDNVVNYYAMYALKGAYKDTAVLSDLRAYTYAYPTDAGADEKAETKAAAEELYNEWKALPEKEKTADEFAHLGHHVVDEGEEAVACNDYKDYNGTLDEKVDEWANDNKRKPGDVTLIETASGFYVVYYEAKNEEANWEMSVRTALGNEAYDSYAEELTDKEEYVLVKDGAIMSTALKLHKSKLERDMKTYLYSLIQSMQQQSSNSYSSDSHAGHSH